MQCSWEHWLDSGDHEVEDVILRVAAFQIVEGVTSGIDADLVRKFCRHKSVSVRQAGGEGNRPGRGRSEGEAAELFSPSSVRCRLAPLSPLGSFWGAFTS